jgi:hypothetical protein
VSESGKSYQCGTDAWRADAKQNICRGRGKLEGFAGKVKEKNACMYLF